MLDKTLAGEANPIAGVEKSWEGGRGVDEIKPLQGKQILSHGWRWKRGGIRKREKVK